MTTKPMHDIQSIIRDADSVLACARQDLGDKNFGARISKHEVDVLEAKIASLKAGAGNGTAALVAQVAAGAHAAEIRARLVQLLQDVRDDAHLAFAANQATQRAFGVGMHFNAASSSSMEHAGHAVLQAASAQPKEAAAIHLDKKGIHHLEDLLFALEQADVAHVQTANDRHTTTTLNDSIVHAITGELAHIRLAAKRVYRDDPAKLDRYASALPRHAVKHRSKHAPDPASGAPAPSAS